MNPSLVVFMSYAVLVFHVVVSYESKGSSYKLMALIPDVSLDERRQSVTYTL